jgi:hypothetical protein
MVGMNATHQVQSMSAVQNMVTMMMTTVKKMVVVTRLMGRAGDSDTALTRTATTSQHPLFRCRLLMSPLLLNPLQKFQLIQPPTQLLPLHLHPTRS